MMDPENTKVRNEAMRRIKMYKIKGDASAELHAQKEGRDAGTADRIQ
jgi:hypothetical protein